ncbi:MAG: translation elongation factor Ts [Candidatus Eremiobacterota bacterium]
MAVTAELVKELRTRTGAGIMDCREALEKSEGNLDQAADWLRQKGIARAEKKASRATSEGQVISYIHPGGRVGVLIEVNCETDFVAKTEDFQKLCQELAMQVAAMSPVFVRREDIPQELVDKELAGYRQAVIEEGKPEHMADKIAQGKVEKYFEQQCLLEQPYMREGSKKINDLVKETVGKLGENIQVRRFVRYSLGDA